MCSIKYPVLGAVVFHNDSVLLVKRKNPPNQNQWCIPGGKVLPGESLKKAAEREIYEETGIAIRAGEPIYSFEVIGKTDSGELEYHYVVIDFLAEYITGEPKGHDDAIEATWVSRGIFNQLTISDITRLLLSDKYNFP